MKDFVLLVSYSLILLHSSAVECKTIEDNGCTIDLREDGRLPEIAPIMTNDLEEWVLPIVDDAKIMLESGAVVRMACPDSGFENSHLEGNNFWTTKCVSGLEFQVEELGRSFDYADLGCDGWPEETIKQKGSCGPNNEGTVIEIGFPITISATKVLITTCLDTTTYQSLWARHVVPKQIAQRNTYGNMPYFSDDGLYHDFQVEVYNYYTKIMQTETIGVLVGSADLAAEYVEQSSDVFMARGHLAPKADFMYTSWQRATYHYVNVQAQWQIFNAGNWLYIETAVRDFVTEKAKDYLVITGSHGLLQLDDINGNKIEIHLNLEQSNIPRRLPAPRLFWKMVVDETENLGVVLIGVNNPHLGEQEIDETYRVCESIPGHPLLNDVKDPDDIPRGIAYACSVSDAQKVIPEIPTDIPISGVLN